MNAAVDVAEVRLWDHRVGAVALDGTGTGVFEYDEDFLKLGLDIAPITMPLEEARNGRTLHSFPALNRETFKRLPGLLADTLPDKFGQAIVNTWLARQGRSPDDFSIIERLCYTGSRAMGALEFTPVVIQHLDKAVDINIDEMVKLVREVTSQRNSINAKLTDNAQEKQHALLDILFRQILSFYTQVSGFFIYQLECFFINNGGAAVVIIPIESSARFTTEVSMLYQ